ncbi:MULTISPECIES: acyltransferase family protein [unclassified Agarivorans]|uniref:acyltransferase family protein n=1 Tax=unclassified Agarivorans TaxID=2636026 RepID=UPI0026E35365|nr:MULTISPECIES: acyltransferase [unclassified Agarivorans]MDO6686120.1 acyltransferase [Agarivorans sp. 3_MG-2023]MDO6716431.1 acyltransferase [Agarivorans sp. 2_MG-2023]
MFGTVRTLWALMVVFGHLFWLSDFGRFAVFGFYILSGYLMTYVMHNSYGYNASGRKRFALNRFLRLFPPYWFACLISIVLLLVFATQMPSGGFSTIALPNNMLSVFGNITMVFAHWIPHSITPRLSPAAWALTVELFFYVAICLGISKTFKRTIIWLSLSLLFIGFSYAANLYWHARYFSIPAGSLPFSIGALIYFIVKLEKVPQGLQCLLTRPALILISMVSISAIVAWLIPQGINPALVELMFYLNMLVSALLVLSLAMGNSISSKISKGFDKFVGDFSYPIYLLHYQISMVASVLLLGEVSKFKDAFSLEALLLVCLGLIAISLFVIKCIDVPVEKVRNVIRHNTSKASPSTKATLN